LTGQQIAQQQAKKYKVRSLLDPEIMVTGPGGERLKSSKPSIHPTTAFDHGGGSGLNTPLDSDTEAEITDIKRAQKLSVVMTSISSTPETSRCVRTIYRGDFVGMQKDAAENHRRVRKYLVATDLSDEAQHALEWTVGTVLRDGDTLLAIYCVDEETGIPRPDGDPMLASDSATLTAQAATIVAATNKLQTPAATIPAGHGLSPLGGTHSNTASPMGRARSAVEQERIKAVQDITDRVTKLLRKTRLQVRIVIEVIHCKSPKHLITEVIDILSPTLVILGSRGRSALKGSVPLPINCIYKTFCNSGRAVSLRFKRCCSNRLS
jgi:nucleotide-binding universal stress UspA family protein